MTQICGAPWRLNVYGTHSFHLRQVKTLETTTSSESVDMTHPEFFEDTKTATPISDTITQGK